MREAAPRYEGVKVFLNHPKPGDVSDRPFADWAGVVENVRMQADGLYGDLRLRKQGPRYREIIEGAQQFNDSFGASHIADIDSDFRGGVEYVKRIVEVFSVDLVLDPATTRGVFESRSQADEEEYHSLKRRLAVAQESYARLTGQPYAAEPSPEFMRRFERSTGKATEATAQRILQQFIRESVANVAPQPAVDIDAALEMIRSILSGKAQGTASMSYQQRIDAGLRRLKAALSGGQLEPSESIGGGRAILGTRHHGGPGPGVNLPG